MHPERKTLYGDKTLYGEKYGEKMVYRLLRFDRRAVSRQVPCPTAAAENRAMKANFSRRSIGSLRSLSQTFRLATLRTCRRA